jgi:DNA repair exonuclease SbcCD ATPase subunit
MNSPLVGICQCRTFHQNKYLQGQNLKARTTGPTTVLRYLGFEIDTLLMMILIPQEKIDKLMSMLQPIILKKKVKVKHLDYLPILFPGNKQPH